MRIGWLEHALMIPAADPHWIPLAKSALGDEMSALTTALSCVALTAGGLEAWIDKIQATIAQATAQLAAVRDQSSSQVLG